MILRGRALLSAVEPSPRSRTSSSWMIFTICWPGVTPFRTSWPAHCGLDPLREFPGHLEVDVGGQQGGADLGQRRCHVFLGQLPDAAKVAQGRGELVGQGFKHVPPTRCHQAMVGRNLGAGFFGMANREPIMRQSRPL